MYIPITFKTPPHLPTSLSGDQHPIYDARLGPDVYYLGYCYLQPPVGHRVNHRVDLYYRPTDKLLKQDAVLAIFAAQAGPSGHASIILEANLDRINRAKQPLGEWIQAAMHVLVQTGLLESIRQGTPLTDWGIARC